MVNKRTISAAIFFLIILILSIISPKVFQSSQISESFKNIFGYAAKGCATLGFISLVYFTIKK